MIDPLTALGIGAGARLANNIVDKLSQTATTAATAGISFDDLLTDNASKAAQKLFAQYPEIKEQLGSGPYTLKQSGSTLTVTSAEGKSLTLDNTSALGQKATFLANSINLKNIEKGLEFQAV